MSIASVEAELVQLEKRASVLKKRLRHHRSKKLSQLPATVGLKSVDGLIAELAVHASAPLRLHLKPYFATADLSGERLITTAQHVRIIRMSPETKARVKADLEDGQKTSELIARENGVSKGTVDRLKRKLGLTRKPSEGIEATSGVAAP